MVSTLSYKTSGQVLEEHVTLARKQGQKVQLAGAKITDGSSRETLCEILPKSVVRRRAGLRGQHQPTDAGLDLLFLGNY